MVAPVIGPCCWITAMPVIFRYVPPAFSAMASQVNSEFSAPRLTESLGANVQSGWWDKTSCGSFYSSDGVSSSSGADYEAWHELGEFVARAREAGLDPFEIES